MTLAPGPQGHISWRPGPPVGTKWHASRVIGCSKKEGVRAALSRAVAQQSNGFGLDETPLRVNCGTRHRISFVLDVAR
jgi:hypothetical protein